MAKSSYEVLVKEYEKSIEWLKAHNEDGHHSKSIDWREKQLKRLKENPF